MPADNIAFSDDDAVLEFEPNIEDTWPRLDEDGNGRRDWRVQRRLATREIERYFRATRSTAEPFELGRIGLRTQKQLRDPEACLTLHYIFIAADTQGDQSAFFARKAAHYYDVAMNMLGKIALQMDYDADNSGTTDDNENNQPMPMRFIRG